MATAEVTVLRGTTAADITLADIVDIAADLRVTARMSDARISAALASRRAIKTSATCATPGSRRARPAMR